MSMAIQRSKYTGDPGIFGDIWGGIKGAAQVGLGLASNLPVVGGFAKTAQNILFRPAPGTTTYAQNPYGTPIPQFPLAPPGNPAPQTLSDYNARCRARGVADWSKCGRQDFDASRGDPFRIGPVTIPRPYLGDYPGPDPINGAAMQAGKPCPVSGYHWNKSGYFLKSGAYVHPGTKMVKNRRRNPANPRATSNAITRIKGAKRYAKSLGRITIRDASKH